jgi:CxxC motif-containing protein (DUF1111 family)
MRLVLVIAFFCSAFVVLAQQAQAPKGAEAPTGFDGGHNGLVGDEDFLTDKEEFDGAEEFKDGLGPVYNAQSCRECHQNPISGGASQVTELRVGYRGANGRFENPRIKLANGTEVTGRSLVNDRAICPDVQMRVPEDAPIRSLRLSISVLGDGFVEAVADQTLIDISKQQCAATRGRICGQVINVPIVESKKSETRAGRFGWKNQHASLVSFSADAYLNEMGITSELQKEEVVADTCGFKEPPPPQPNSPTEPGLIDDVNRFARFMRATKAPPRDAKLAATGPARQGEQLFAQVGCAICHVPTLQTAPTGTSLTSEFTVPPALGSKIIHPFSDFLLHNVGTGDGIVMVVEEHHGRDVRRRNFRNFSDRDVDSTQFKIRTAPLWGVRMRTRLMHDGASVTLNDAIRRHRGEASEVTERYERLSSSEREALLTFLRSL